MRIFRSNPEDHFTILPNETLRDQRLSYTARGVLMELLSHADGWETNADALSQLARQRRGDKRGEGRRAIRAAFAELEEHGYMVRRKVRGEGGLFTTVLEVYDTPGHRGAATGTPDEVDVWSQPDDRDTANGTSVNGTSVNGTSVSGTSSRSTNKEPPTEEPPNEEHSSSLADAREGALAQREIAAQRQQLIEAVRRLDDLTLRNFMLTFEHKRPRIFRQCRHDAGAWLKETQPGILKNDRVKAMSMDQVTYMYALLHYEPEAPGDWPAWVLKPLAGLVGSQPLRRAS